MDDHAAWPGSLGGSSEIGNAAKGRRDRRPRPEYRPDAARPLCPGRDPHHSRILTAQAVTLTRLRRASSLRSVGVPIALLSSMTTMAIPALAVIGPETFGPGKATCERLGASQFDCLLTSLRVSDNGNDMATFGLATRRRRNGPSSKNGVPLPRRITPCKATEPGRFHRLLICRP